jgi:hypothetical protein
VGARGNRLPCAGPRQCVTQWPHPAAVLTFPVHQLSGAHISDIICYNDWTPGEGVPFDVWGYGVLRALNVGFMLCAALLVQGCAADPERIPVDDASEAQRLVFGAPKAVRTQFASQIGACWFASAGPLKGDYTFTLPSNDSPDEPSLIRVFRVTPQRDEVFQIHFYPHNENTVVATRNLDLPEQIANDLETSVELWLLEPSQCVASEDAVAGETPWDPRLQQARAGEDELQLPPLDEDETRSEDEEVDMHQAELRARGAIQ